MGIKILKENNTTNVLYLWSVSDTPIFFNNTLQNFQTLMKVGRIREEGLDGLKIDVNYPYLDWKKDFKEIDRIDNHGKGDDVWYRLKNYTGPFKRSIDGLPFTDEQLIELCKNNCTLHKTSEELGFTVWFELEHLKDFCYKLLELNNKQ